MLPPAWIISFQAPVAVMVHVQAVVVIAVLDPAAVHARVDVVVTARALAKAQDNADHFAYRCWIPYE